MDRVRIYHSIAAGLGPAVAIGYKVGASKIYFIGGLSFIYSYEEFFVPLCIPLELS